MAETVGGGDRDARARRPSTRHDGLRDGRRKSPRYAAALPREPYFRRPFVRELPTRLPGRPTSWVQPAALCFAQSYKSPPSWPVPRAPSYLNRDRYPYVRSRGRLRNLKLIRETGDLCISSVIPGAAPPSIIFGIARPLNTIPQKLLRARRAPSGYDQPDARAPGIFCIKAPSSLMSWRVSYCDSLICGPAATGRPQGPNTQKLRA